MKIELLIEAAKAAKGITSDRALMRELGIASSNIVRWRKGELPSDENVVALCQVAGVPPEPWLIELNIERAGPKAAKVYHAMLTAAQRIALVVLVALPFFHQGTTPERISPEARDQFILWRILVHRFARLLRLFPWRSAADMAIGAHH